MDFFVKLLLQQVNGKNWKPVFNKSTKYKNWIAILDPRTCPKCRSNHGTIFLINEIVEKEPPLHFYCRCSIPVMETVKSGTATIDGFDGADWSLKHESKLPEYYIEKSKAIQSGWKPGKWPSNFIQNKMIIGGEFHNDNGHLPQHEGRIWYEADINYKSGKRNTQRILWSNDGLIFVTYDHYETFFEVV